MQTALIILLSMVAMICFLGGGNLLIKGSTSFLPQGTPPIPRLDNIFRFLSAIYLGLGFLTVWIILHTTQAGDVLYFVGLVVTFSGLGRLYSRVKVGPAGTYHDVIMVVEILGGIAIATLHYLMTRQ
jgi:hypothetical protein